MGSTEGVAALGAEVGGGVGAWVGVGMGVGAGIGVGTSGSTCGGEDSDVVVTDEVGSRVGGAETAIASGTATGSAEGSSVRSVWTGADSSWSAALTTAVAGASSSSSIRPTKALGTIPSSPFSFRPLNQSGSSSSSAGARTVTRSPFANDRLSDDDPGGALYFIKASEGYG